jgi:hypothetical protein
MWIVNEGSNVRRRDGGDPDVAACMPLVSIARPHDGCGQP